jgi:hypothetical protein
LTFATAGQATILVNDALQPVNIFDLNSRAGYHPVVPVQLVLKPGDVNTLRFGAIGTSSKYSIDQQCYGLVLIDGPTGFEVSIDGIELYNEE